jgi:dienelactone hydrolase
MSMPGDSCNRRVALQRVGLAALAGTFVTAPSSFLRGDDQIPQTLGKTPDDRRLGPLRDLNGYFPFEPTETLEQWEKRAELVRRRILVASGLWPLPVFEPVHAVIHGRVQRSGYSVERVYFESTPGLFVTGSLYRPDSNSETSGNARLPAILSPHGHWSQGRFYDHGEAGVRAEIDSGAEKYPHSGRFPLQARCVQLARMGCIVFHYDMLGYADSSPLTEEVGHRLNQQREHMKSPEHWGLFSAQSELRLLNAFGLQTLSSLRAMDWLCSLPEVDAERIGVTGASGGGTQTFILAAIDSRPAAAFPAVMVSTAMQGGCTCENATYLRIDTGNIEFAAMCAPRPLGLTGANDWTREIETKGLPELERHYTHLGAADKLEGKYYDFPHNYNYVSRAQMYAFFNRHLNLGWESPIVEQDFEPLSRDELTVWNEEHPRPACDDEAEVRFLRDVDARWQRQFASLRPHDAASWENYRSVIKPAFEIMTGRGLPESNDVTFENVVKLEFDQYRHFVGLLRLGSRGEALPTAFLLPKQWKEEVVLWFSGNGKAELFRENGAPRRRIQRLLDAGTAVGSVDVLYTGEFLEGAQALQESRRVDNTRQIAAYTMGYNHPLFAQRVHDVLTTVAYAKNHEWKPQRIHLVGTSGAAPWVAAAAIEAGASIDKVALDTEGFRFATITEIRDPQLWPGAVRYGDLPGLLSLCAPLPLWIAGEKREDLELTGACYRASGHGDRLQFHEGPRDQRRPAMLRWLMS